MKLSFLNSLWVGSQRGPQDKVVLHTGLSSGFLLLCTLLGSGCCTPRGLWPFGHELLAGPRAIPPGHLSWRVHTLCEEHSDEKNQVKRPGDHWGALCKCEPSIHSSLLVGILIRSFQGEKVFDTPAPARKCSHSKFLFRSTS